MRYICLLASVLTAVKPNHPFFSVMMNAIMTTAVTTAAAYVDGRENISL